MPSVIDVDYLGGHRLYLGFDDGKCGGIDLLPFIERIESLHDLKDTHRFIQFSLSDGTIAWGYDRDVSPRWLHDYIQ